MAYLKAGLLLLAGAVVVGMAAEAAGAHPTPAGSWWQWLGPVSAGLGLFSFAAGGRVRQMLDAADPASPVGVPA